MGCCESKPSEPAIPDDHSTADTNMVTVSAVQVEVEDLNTQQDLPSLPERPTHTIDSLQMDKLRGKKIYKAIHNYEKCSNDGIGFHKGDFLEITFRDGEWWFALHLDTKEEGYVPRNYLAAADSLDSNEWFHSKISREHSERLLLQPGYSKGTFLVRNSETIPGTCTLSVRSDDDEKGDHIKKFTIHTMSHAKGFFIVKRLTFPSLQELVAHYQDSGLLVQPCSKPKPMMIDLSRETRDNWEIPRSSLEFEEQLGAGTYGEVWRGKWKGIVPVSITALNKGMDLDDMYLSDDDRSKDAFLAEANIVKSLVHINIIRLYAVCSQELPMYIITELVPNGSLLDYLRGPEGRELQLNRLINMAGQIANGMMYLERKEYVHSDLAARNVLVGDNHNLKIKCFCLSKILKGDTYKFRVKWTAPEVAVYGKSTIKSDVWSFGILLFELMTKGQIPYPGMNDRNVLIEVERGYRLPCPQGTPDALYKIMFKCWNADPECRPTFDFLNVFIDDYIHTQ